MTPSLSKNMQCHTLMYAKLPIRHLATIIGAVSLVTADGQSFNLPHWFAWTYMG